MIRNMTKGSPMRLIIGFSLPLLAGNLFQQVYTLADTIIVGRFLGSNALAAVGSTGSLVFMLFGLCAGFTGGFSVLIAQRFGAGDIKGVRRAVFASYYLTVIISVLITFISVFFCKDILRLMNTPENIFEGAYTYIVILFAGTILTMFYNLFSSILRALGDSRSSLVFLVISACLNIGLDIIFIVNFKMGIMGAALATIISQGAAAICCIIYIFKKVPILRFEKDEIAYDSRSVAMALKMGIPMAMQYFFTAFGVIILQSTINVYGSDVVAGFAAANKIENLFIAIYITLGLTMATYTGQNFGAGKFDRIRKGVKCGYILIGLSILVCAPVLYFFGQHMAIMFIDPSETQIMLAVARYFRIIAIPFVGIGVILMLRSVVQGLGWTTAAFMIGVLELAARVIVCFTLPAVLGLDGAYLANPIAWIAGAVVFSIIYFPIIKRTEKKLFKTKNLQT